MTSSSADIRPSVRGLPHAAERDFALGIPGFTYGDLHDPQRLAALLDVFDARLGASDPELAARYLRARSTKGSDLGPTEISRLIVDVARHVSGFVGRLFGVEEDLQRIVESTRSQDPIFRFKKEFLGRRARATTPVPPLASVEARAHDLLRLGFPEILPQDEELALARAVVELLDLEAGFLPPRGAKVAAPSPAETERARALRASVPSLEPVTVERVATESLELLAGWCRALKREAPHRVEHWASFGEPEPVDPFDLVPTEVPLPWIKQGPTLTLRRRDGFELTDRRMGGREVLDEVHYCIYCHDRDKDSCSKGYKDREGKIVKNALGIRLDGCPLDEKISEAHLLRKEGDVLAALACIIVDNPMCPGTGHRICNDCMKGCIFQKQEPVNIPQIETNVLTDVLRLPWGVEIFGLLTRFNPVNLARPVCAPFHGKKVLVVGLGPAGYTLAHYLLNEGFGVVGIDGLKIEPLPGALTGHDAWPPKPVREYSDIETALDQRILEGFGGVSEYGITVRWDKNFLTLLHLTLARRDKLAIYGGVRFGGTLTLEDAWRLGFDHVAIATGAGRPTIIDMQNNLIRGVRKASDFLMALQLTGAFKDGAMANLQVRLPAVVVGGGLTAIDTATELFAYYPRQVERVLARHETLCAELGEQKVLATYDAEEREILAEFSAHARAFREERRRAAAVGEEPNFVPMVRGFGGVTIAYRKGMVDSPAYRLNHEEIIKALEEGIWFAEGLVPVEAVPDQYGAVKTLRCDTGKGAAELLDLPARSVLVAAGTTPNIIYEKERRGTFEMDAKGKFFRNYRVDGDGRLVPVGPAERGFFTSYDMNGRRVTFYGDNHPEFAGNVVKAMASAKNGYPEIVRLFREEIERVRPEQRQVLEEDYARFTRELDDGLVARVDKVVRLTPTIVEVIVRAPFAARQFHPGQFYRLQNFEMFAPVVRGARLTMEGIALTGAWRDRHAGIISLIVLEMGASSRLCAYLRPGEPVVVMGPTGTATEIPKDEAVLLAGGGLGNAVLFSIAQALSENGCKVIYFAGYKKGEDLFKQDDIERATDQIIWSTDTGAEIRPRRPQDAHFRGNIVQAIKSYGRGELGERIVDLASVRRIIAIGSDRMMAAMARARHGELKEFLGEHVGIASVNSSMQCMMKEVCAQCLQKHVDPVTGKETEPVFTCFNQDQKLDEVDWKNLNDRLKTNSLVEKQTSLWLTHLLQGVELPHV